MTKTELLIAQHRNKQTDRVQYCHKLCDKMFKIPLMNQWIPGLEWENIIYRKNIFNLMLAILNYIWEREGELTTNPQIIRIMERLQRFKKYILHATLK